MRYIKLNKHIAKSLNETLADELAKVIKERRKKQKELPQGVKEAIKNTLIDIYTNNDYERVMLNLYFFDSSDSSKFNNIKKYKNKFNLYVKEDKQSYNVVYTFYFPKDLKNSLNSYFKNEGFSLGDGYEYDGYYVVRIFLNTITALLNKDD